MPKRLIPHADSATIPAVTSASSQQQSRGVAADTPLILPMKGAQSKPVAHTRLTLPVEGTQSKPAIQPSSTLHEHELPVAAKTEDQPRNYDINVPRSVPVTS